MMLAHPPLWLILDRVRLRSGAARLLPRARPLSRRALVQGPGRGLLDRLRTRDVRLDRQAGHAVESRVAAAWRLRQVRWRHEPGEHAGGPREHSRASARPGVPDFARSGSVSSSFLPARSRTFILAIVIFAGFFSPRSGRRPRTSSAQSSPTAPRPGPVSSRVIASCRWRAGRRRPSTTSVRTVAVRPDETVVGRGRAGWQRSRTSGYAQDATSSRIADRPERSSVGCSASYPAGPKFASRCPLFKAVPDGGRVTPPDDRGRWSTAIVQLVRGKGFAQATRRADQDRTSGGRGRSLGAVAVRRPARAAFN